MSVEFLTGIFTGVILCVVIFYVAQTFVPEMTTLYQMGQRDKITFDDVERITLITESGEYQLEVKSESNQ